VTQEPNSNAASWSYTVVRHEYVKTGPLAMVTIKCIGYPTEGVQPVEWEFSFLAPHNDLPKWPLGKNVRLVIS